MTNNSFPVTHITHDQMSEELINGYEPEFHRRKGVIYDSTLAQIDALKVCGCEHSIQRYKGVIMTAR